ncbi:WW domain-containing protein [Giardia muris]|uniref:WW domain-containing protein n=1 Tax=Giardia muris TaxID=5742 RepID=A0A4Z1SYG5_GIAMU|nr:WW domain-containing protein [Giardia muris]|eukprot:TNJ26713.1 WW domain-containing protein [Giardia muris]
MYLEDCQGEDYVPDPDEVREYATMLGFELPGDEDLLYIAEEGLKAPLPPGWRAVGTSAGEVYYCNVQTKETFWEHPMDEHFKQRFLEAKRAKLAGKTKKGALQEEAPRLRTPDEEKDDQDDLPTTESEIMSVTDLRTDDRYLSSRESEERPTLPSEPTPLPLTTISTIHLEQDVHTPMIIPTRPSQPPPTLEGTQELESLAEQKRRNLEEQQALAQTHLNEMQRLIEAHNQKMAELRASHDKELADTKAKLNREYAIEYDAIRERHETRLAGLRERAKKEGQEIEAAHQEELRSLKQRYEHMQTDSEGYARRLRALQEEQSETLRQVNALEEEVEVLRRQKRALLNEREKLQLAQAKPHLADSLAFTTIISPDAGKTPSKTIPATGTGLIEKVNCFTPFGAFVINCLPDPARCVLLQELLRIQVYSDFLKRQKAKTDLKVKSIEAKRTAFVTQTQIIAEDTADNATVRRLYEERKALDHESKLVNDAIRRYREASDWLSDRRSFCNLFLGVLLQTIPSGPALLRTLTKAFSENPDLFANAPPMSTQEANRRLSAGFSPLVCLDTPGKPQNEPIMTRQQKEQYVRSRALESIQQGDYRTILLLVNAVYGPMASQEQLLERGLQYSRRSDHPDTLEHLTGGSVVVKKDDRWFIQRLEEIPQLIGTLYSGTDDVGRSSPHSSAGIRRPPVEGHPHPDSKDRSLSRPKSRDRRRREVPTTHDPVVSEWLTEYHQVFE